MGRDVTKGGGGVNITRTLRSTTVATEERLS